MLGLTKKVRLPIIKMRVPIWAIILIGISLVSSIAMAVDNFLIEKGLMKEGLFTKINETIMGMFKKKDTRTED